jgi:hypothetical protein
MSKKFVPPPWAVAEEKFSSAKAFKKPEYAVEESKAPPARTTAPLNADDEYVKSAAAGLGRGATFGFDDWLAGATQAGAAGLSKLLNKAGISGDALGIDTRYADEVGVGDTFKQGKDAHNAEYERLKAKNPYTVGASELAGNLLTTAATAGLGAEAGAGAKALTTSEKALQGMKFMAPLSAAGAVGANKDDLVSGDLKRTGKALGKTAVATGLGTLLGAAGNAFPVATGAGLAGGIELFGDKLGMTDAEKHLAAGASGGLCCWNASRSAQQRLQQTRNQGRRSEATVHEKRRDRARRRQSRGSEAWG